MWFPLMILCACAVYYWQATVAIIAIFLVVKISQRGQARYTARRAAEAERVQGLINRATKQHRQIQKGKLGGVYGAYPPAQECRGVGIWLAE